MNVASLSSLRVRADHGLILALLLTLFVVIPLVSNPGLSKGHDTTTHSFRAAEMARSWEQGLLFPSWAEGMYFGYGSPLFHFYARLSYMLAALLQFVFGMDALNALRWLLALCLFASSGGMYLFCKRRSGRLGAVIAGLLYVYSPYLMYTEAYARGAYPELLALALFPLLLWRVDALRDKPSAGNFLLACLLQIGLVNSHNLMAVVLTGMAFAWIAFETLLQWFNREASQMTARGGALAALALALGIFGSATFWLPVVLERDSVQLENLLVASIVGKQWSLIRLETLFSPTPIADIGAQIALRPVHALGLAQWGLAGSGVVTALGLYIRGYRTRHPQTFLGLTCFAVVACLLIGLMLPAAEGLWNGLRPLQFMQFPWRFLGPVAACLAIAGGMNGLWLDRLDRRYQIGAIAMCAALPIVAVIPLLYVPNWEHRTLDTSIAALHAAEYEGHLGTTASNEFLPRDSDRFPWASWSLMTDYGDGYPVDKLNRATLPAGAEAELLHNSPQSLSWRVTTEIAFVAEIYNLYWLGWRAELNGRELGIMPSERNGFITAPVPAGDHVLRVYLGSTPIRDFAAHLSLLSIVCAGLTAAVLSRFTIPERPYWRVPPLGRNAVRGILLGGCLALLCLLITFREGVAWINSPPGEALPAQVRRSYTLDGAIRLLGYSLNAERFRPGDVLVLDLFWYALEAPEIDFSSFIHLSSGGAVHLQVDKTRPGSVNTRAWGPEGYILDSYELRLPEHIPSDDYALIVGLYTCEPMPAGNCGNGYRPTATDESGEVIGDSIPLARIRLEAP